MAHKEKRQIIVPNSSYAPIAPYSQGVRVGNFIFVAGQIGLDPNTNQLVKGGTAAEAEMALKNIGNVLTAAGVNFDSVARCTIFLMDLNDYAAVNDVYKNFFTQGKYPARVAFQVSALPKGARVEIEAVAVASA